MGSSYIFVSRFIHVLQNVIPAEAGIQRYLNGIGGQVLVFVFFHIETWLFNLMDIERQKTRPDPLFHILQVLREFSNTEQPDDSCKRLELFKL